MKGPWEFIPIPPAPFNFGKTSGWAEKVERALPIGREVEVYHRGMMRRGRISGLAPKATINRRSIWVWVKFSDPELVSTMYESKLEPLSRL